MAKTSITIPTLMEHPVAMIEVVVVVAAVAVVVVVVVVVAVAVEADEITKISQHLVQQDESASEISLELTRALADWWLSEVVLIHCFDIAIEPCP